MGDNKLTKHQIADSGFNLIKFFKYFLYAGRRLYKFILKHVPSKSSKAAAKVNVTFFTEIPTSDISEHLSFLYLYLCSARPLNILELGTRGGESTKVFVRYCSEMNIIGHSIDLNAEPKWLAESKFWKHFVGDDISLGQQINETKKWPNGDIFHELDFIFIDTSHLYTHTLQEIQTYMPLLKKGVGTLAFHDTNLLFKPTRRLDGKINLGWDNQRGVARAIEDYFNFEFREDTLQVQLIANQKFVFYHQPWSNGFSILAPYHGISD